MLTESELCQDPKKNFEDAAPATLSREEETCIICLDHIAIGDQCLSLLGAVEK